MLEAKVIEIHKAQVLSGYSREELMTADKWVKDYALSKLAVYLKAAGMTETLREYVLLMARCHYGSVETDEFLRANYCYPEWLITR